MKKLIFFLHFNPTYKNLKTSLAIKWKSIKTKFVTVKNN